MAAAGQFAGVFGGLSLPRAALSFLWRHKRLWPLALAPFLINLALFAAFFWLAYDRFQQWVLSLVPVGEGWWWAALYYLLIVLAVLVLLVVMVYLFAVVGNLLACPFLELLTRRVEMAAAGRLPEGPGQGMRAFFGEVLRVGGQQIKKVLLYVLVMGLLLLLNLAPGIGTAVYGVLAWLATCYFLVLEFVDYPLDRRGLSLGRKLAYVWRLRLAGLGFGAALFIQSIIPVLNLLLLPLGAVGATLLYLDKPLEPAVPPMPPPDRV